MQLTIIVLSICALCLPLSTTGQANDYIEEPTTERAESTCTAVGCDLQCSVMGHFSKGKCDENVCSCYEPERFKHPLQEAVKTTNTPLPQCSPQGCNLQCRLLGRYFGGKCDNEMCTCYESHRNQPTSRPQGTLYNKHTRTNHL